MGLVISFSRGLTERIAIDNKLKLYLGGLIITLIVVSSSGISGWIIERLFLFFEIKNPILSTLFFGLILSSSLASRSLNKSILEILNIISKENTIDNFSNLRQKLSLIVGRDVDNLDTNEILRALAETASENSVDGIFAPLFWMFLGTIFWEFNQSMPGPLAMSWIFKASSTIDSMLGYKKGKLKWGPPHVDVFLQKGKKSPDPSLSHYQPERKSLLGIPVALRLRARREVPADSYALPKTTPPVGGVDGVPRGARRRACGASDVRQSAPGVGRASTPVIILLHQEF